MNRNAEFAFLERQAGIYLPGVLDYLKPEWKANYDLAMDAQPSLVTVGSSGIPGFLTNFIDADILKVLTAKNQAATIIGEVRKGSWTDITAMFPVVEQTGEVTSYGDFNSGGRAGINANFPTRENYLFQTTIEYGELEMERAGLAKISYASEVKAAAVAVIGKFANTAYFFGVQGLQNYGLLNDPSLSAPIAPAVKAAGGVKWWNNNVLNATANEIYADIQSLFVQLVIQAAGNVDQKTPLVLALSPKSESALTATNQYNVNVGDLLKKNFPNLRIESAVQYGALSAQNPQGSAAGEVVQMIAETIEGQQTAYAAFSEKLRTHPIIREMSAFKQKVTAGVWGTVLRQPFGISQMLGV